jgi:hypothetical protein
LKEIKSPLTSFPAIAQCNFEKLCPSAKAIPSYAHFVGPRHREHPC